MGGESTDHGGRRSELRSGLIADACSRFEAAWQSSQPPRIEDFLPTCSPRESGATLGNLLVQLVGVDLEWRWKTACRVAQTRSVARKKPSPPAPLPEGEGSAVAPARLPEGEGRCGSAPLSLRPRLADYVARYPLLGPVERLPCDLILDEYYARRCYGDRPTHAEYLDAFGALHPDLAKQLQAIDDGMAPSDPNAACGQAEEHGLTGTAPFGEAPPPELPQLIGRYRVERLLGSGGFGIVYLAHDEQLHRRVAIKVPHARLVARPEDAEPYLTEARTVANLDHPNIVPVYDVGSTEEFPVYVVCKFIDGISLAGKMYQTRLALTEATELVSTVAEALHYAHKQGLVHRDIKPGNILLDRSGKPFVADFGLALRDEDSGGGSRYAGTPAYMSPEQARGEAHRVDGRSDVFSLGIVLYELLAGRRPFRSEDKDELRDQIATLEPKPLRQTDDAIPKELERICLRALSKRATERYSTAKDLADDLRHFLAEGLCDISSPVPPAQEALAADTKPPSDTPPATPTPETPPVKIVPKGLRSFDAGDADFFLELLPGPRDREGLPDSIRFWKNRIEETDPDRTFPVGLIYGPSGCGKSSLVKAGLLPRLSRHVIPVYVEATAGETESRLLRGLRKRCPELADDLGLKDTLSALRRGEGIPPGKKVLIVLDQFEQWLHVRKGEDSTELVHALRQCDGGRIQCIVMVRDDFWLAVSRFMHSLEIRLVEGHNSALVDLFDTDHARKVLAAYGRAYGRLPENVGDRKDTQRTFLKNAVQDLAEGGKVVCVRLSLFAEMMKGKPWTPATLKEVGGTEGVGVTFLEETFSASTAPPDHRYHQKGARAVLKALLPDSGTDIKGHMRSYAELLAASGYADRPKDFQDLIGILDGEIRLITPTDPEGKEEADPSTVQAGAKYYQLTHDYLVPSLREWLTRKQRETRKGRAELRLAERSTFWNAKPENRRLPAWWEFLIVWLLVNKKNWTGPQQRMMQKAGKYHVARGLFLLVGLGLVILTSSMFAVKAYQEKAEERLYVDRIAQAHQKWLSGDVGETERLLHACPIRFRHWEWGYLNRLCHLELFTLRGHKSVVHGVSFSPDGQRLATASLDCTVKIWDTASGRELLTLRGHTGGVNSVCFNPDGKRLATASDDHTARIWDATSGQELLALHGHTDAVGSVCFSPDGKRLATGSGDHTAKIWDAVRGQELLTLRAHSRWVNSVCFSRDGRRLATGSDDKTAKIWDAASGQELLTLRGHIDDVNSVCFSRDGRRLATGSNDTTAKVWDAANGQTLLTLGGHASVVRCVCFSLDGKRLATGSGDNTARIWDMASGQTLLTLRGHTNLVYSVCFSPDGKRLATGSKDDTAKIWDAANERDLLTLRGHTGEVSGVCFSPDSTRLATGSGNMYELGMGDNTAKIWDAIGGQELLTLRGHTGAVAGVCFSPDGRRLATGSNDSTAKIWDAASGQELLTLRGHTKGVYGVCFSPDGKWLATGSGNMYRPGMEDNTAKIWDAVNGNELLTLRGHKLAVYCVCFSPDGKRLATASGDNTAKIWDAVNGNELLTLRGHKLAVYCVCFSPDGKRLATASGDETAKIWDAASGQELLTLRGHTSAVYCVCFSPDGKRFATGSADNSVKIWDAASGQELLTLRGHTNLVYRVCFSPDGKRLATASFDTAIIWDAANW